MVVIAAALIVVGFGIYFFSDRGGHSKGGPGGDTSFPQSTQAGLDVARKSNGSPQTHNPKAMPSKPSVDRSPATAEKPEADSMSLGAATKNDLGGQSEAQHTGTSDTEKPHEVPRGWYQGGTGTFGYEFGVDHEVVHSGLSSAMLRSTQSDPKLFGTIHESADAGVFRGQRVEFRMFLAIQDALSVTFFFRANDAQGLTLAFDNLPKSRMQGTSTWQPQVIVIDVPKAAATIGYGATLIGGGTLWMDSAELHVVDKTFATTGPPITPQPYRPEFTSDPRELLPNPENLDFEDTIGIAQ